MKSWNELSPSIQVLVEGYAIQDHYGLQPSTLYKNIAESLQTSEPQSVATVFEVSISLCEMIQEINADN